MRVIDAHVHLYPPDVGRDPAAWAAAQREGHWAGLCTRRRKNGRPVQGFPTVEALLRAMDSAGIEKSVLLGWYWENPATCAEQNRFYAKCIRAHPDRLAAFASVHPAGGTEALTEVERVKAEGFVGLGELSPHSQHVRQADETWRKILALAGDLGLPVNLHVTDPHSRPYPGRVETPLADFRTLAADFPNTTFVLAHWGGGLAFDAVSRALTNVYYDTAASPLLYGPEAWGRAIAAVGVERLLFGSDYPLILYPQQESMPAVGGLLAEARGVVPESAQAALLGGTSARLLRL